MEVYENHHFLLDSGAFTYLNKHKGNVDWDAYIDDYANFIIKHKVDLFFELDIDPIVGLDEVERLRGKLEKLVGKKCIPVWHRSRGKEYWLRMVRDYDYVAIGGIVIGEIKRTEFPIFNYLLKEAKKQNCKVHGLGFTNLKALKTYPFYSVDSTSWIAGQQFCSMMQYLGDGEFKMHKPKEGQIGINPKERLTYNFREWVKYQKYALEYL
jgi:hypothetical protein